EPAIQCQWRTQKEVAAECMDDGFVRARLGLSLIDCTVSVGIELTKFLLVSQKLGAGHPTVVVDVHAMEPTWDVDRSARNPGRLDRTGLIGSRAEHVQS